MEGWCLFITSLDGKARGAATTVQTFHTENAPAAIIYSQCGDFQPPENLTANFSQIVNFSQIDDVMMEFTKYGVRHGIVTVLTIRLLVISMVSCCDRQMSSTYAEPIRHA